VGWLIAVAESIYRSWADRPNLMLVEPRGVITDSEESTAILKPSPPESLSSTSASVASPTTFSCPPLMSKSELRTRSSERMIDPLVTLEVD
jgi:hypothetical protein